MISNETLIMLCVGRTDLKRLETEIIGVAWFAMIKSPVENRFDEREKKKRSIGMHLRESICNKS